ncbi:DUF4132 domain-containing protein [Actinomadura atramentaria]|uniref:DUF4132 domain-containing protein n=1 Tax=Actinomadura atramentaria TaxID=1990 RepID=UPI00039CACAC|nr:DUF4132 domain-containing protein [Actinomadura atramentaria]
MTDAAVLLRSLTEPRPDDAALLPGLDASGLTDVELGSLVPAAYQGNRRGHPATVIAHTVQDEMRARQPRFTPAAVRALFDALVAELPHRDWADLALGVGALFRCTGEPPDVAAPARTLVRALLDRDRLGEPFALLAAAARAGQTAAVRARLTVTGPIAVDEAAVLDALAPDDLLALAEIEDAGGYARPAPHPDAWPRLAALPAVAAFARRALDAAAARVAALHAGDLPYRADKLFTADEVAALGRAARAALLRDEPWLRGLLDGLLTGVAVAPTSAKTLPSQALLYEFARAGQEFPTPELVAALRAARAATRHAGVPKQLGRNLVRVEAALAARADVALRMPDHGFAPDGTLRRTLGDHQAVITAADTATLTFHSARGPLRGVPAAVRRAHPDAVRELRDLTARVGVQLATLTRALEGGFAAVHPYAEWRSGLIDHPVAGAVARRLIWDVDGHTILPVRDALPDAPADAPVRLWHPARATAADVAAWRDALADLEIRQPFRQAYRETYRLSPAEDGGAVRSHRFAAHLVHYRALYALFRSRGWTSGRLGPWDGGDADDAARLLGAGEWRATLAHTLADPSADLAARPAR